MPQTVVIADAIFENQMLKLGEVFIAPQMSSTMSSSDKDNEEDSAKTSKTVTVDDKGGRPELSIEEKSEKTVQNIEAEQ